MLIPRKSLNTSYVSNKTRIHFSDTLSGKPQSPVCLPGVRVLFISVMNTQWRHFLETLDPGQPYLCSYPVLQTTFPSLCPSCLPRVPSLERTHFSHNPRVCLVTIVLCPKKKAICSPGRMCVSRYRSRFLSWLLLLR